MSACERCGHGEGRHRRGGCGGPEDECICIAYVAPTTGSTDAVDDYEGWVETAFLPSVKYAVVWDEARDGWRVLTLDDGGAFS